MTRSSIPQFALANPLYVAAEVSFYSVAGDGISPGELASVYADGFSDQQAQNPQLLDSDGKFFAPVYIDAPVIVGIQGPFEPVVRVLSNTFIDTDILYSASVMFIIAGTLYNADDSFHSATVLAGIGGSLYNDSVNDTFFDAAATSASAVSGSRYDNSATDTFYTATLLVGYVVGSLYNDSANDTFYDATFAGGTVTIIASLFDDSANDAFFDATVMAVGIGGSRYDDSVNDTFFDATVAGDGIGGSTYADTDAFYDATMTLNISGSAYTDTDTFYSSTCTVLANYSLSFSAPSSQYLKATGKTTASAQKFTVAYWLKWISGDNSIIISFNAGNTSNYDTFGFSANHLAYTAVVSGSIVAEIISNATYTDTTSWHHYCLAVDTTQATSSNRVKMYYDGTQITSFSSASYPGINQNLPHQSALSEFISRSSQVANYYINGNLAEFYYIDGQQLTPSSFISGTPGTPIAFTGSYAGTFDFHLPFSDDTSTTTLGTDSSGEGNNWTLNNMTTANQSSDYP